MLPLHLPLWGLDVFTDGSDSHERESDVVGVAESRRRQRDSCVCPACEGVVHEPGGHRRA